MKTNVIIKFAVVAMAAFGAYAFSGNNASSQSQFSIYDDMSKCRDITAECNPSGTLNCTIEVDNSTKVVLGLKCTSEVKHTSLQPVNWSYLPNN